MKAISLWQPWASLWLSDRKVHETRHWPTRHRGALLVHAAKKFIKDIEPGDPLREILDDEFGGHWAMDLPTGAIIGRLDLVDCVPTDGLEVIADDDRACGDFSPGRWGWRRGAYTLFAAPVPWRGSQGIFEVSDDLGPGEWV